MAYARDPAPEIASFLRRRRDDAEIRLGAPAGDSTDNLARAVEGFLITALAAADPAFWHHRWLDGLWIVEAAAGSELELKSAGLAVWAHDRNMFLAPFEFDARIMPNPPRLAGYRIQFGVRDGRTRIAETPYTMESIVRSRMFMYRPRERGEWAFVLNEWNGVQ